MATRYSTSQDDEPSRGRRRATKSSGPPVGPILILVVLMVGAVVVARMAAQGQKTTEEEEPAEVTAESIFGDLPREEPPTRKPGSGSKPKKLYEKAPAGLASNSTWIAAKAVAADAKATLEEAKTAKAAGDHAAWADKGVRAKELYDEAITMTAEWEEELMEKYGDNDRQVSEIKRERDGWFNMLRTLHKTTGR